MARLRITDEMRQKWWKLYFGNPPTPISAIAKRFGVHPNTIQVYIRERRLSEPMADPVFDGVGTLFQELNGRFLDKFSPFNVNRKGEKV